MAGGAGPAAALGAGRPSGFAGIVLILKPGLGAVPARGAGGRAGRALRRRGPGRRPPAHADRARGAHRLLLRRRLHRCSRPCPPSCSWRTPRGVASGRLLLAMGAARDLGQICLTARLRAGAGGPGGPVHLLVGGVRRAPGLGCSGARLPDALSLARQAAGRRGGGARPAHRRRPAPAGANPGAARPSPASRPGAPAGADARDSASRARRTPSPGRRAAAPPDSSSPASSRSSIRAQRSIIARAPRVAQLPRSLCAMRRQASQVVLAPRAAAGRSAPGACRGRTASSSSSHEVGRRHGQQVGDHRPSRSGSAGARARGAAVAPGACAETGGHPPLEDRPRAARG